MSTDNVITIIISILGSSVITLILSTLIFQPMQDKRKYIFDEKKREYESIIIFAQIVLFQLRQDTLYMLQTIIYRSYQMKEIEIMQ